MSDFTAFARTQLPGLLRYAVMLTGERELAADLVQDVMVKAHRLWSRVSAATHPDRYVMHMVTNQYLSWRRRWTVRNNVPIGESPDVPSGKDVSPATLRRSPRRPCPPWPTRISSPALGHR